MGLAERWEQRWKARTPGSQPDPGQGLRTVRLFEAIKLRQDPATVWALVAPAEHSVLLTPDTTARAFTVPGTGPGPGEQQCHVDHDGQATIIEVLELVDNRRAVAVVVSPKPDIPVRMVTAVEALGTGSILTHGMEFETSVQAVWPEPQQDAFRAYAQKYLKRVRQVLEEDSR